MTLSITRPEVVADLDICTANIRRMAARARNAGLIFRPHFKTHQSRAIGRIFRDMGVQAITVSSVSMARYFAADGWNDILIAFPLNLREWDVLPQPGENKALGLLISDTAVIGQLPSVLPKGLYFLLELDTGQGRSGLLADDFGAIREAVSLCDEKSLPLRGFLFHDGHSYLARSQADIAEVRTRTLGLISRLRGNLCEAFPGREFLFSGGDTPTCSLDERYDGIDEIRPGNFVFYDLMQLQLGSCGLADIAARLICPVVAVYPAKNRLVVYGGAIHLGKDYLAGPDGRKFYGQACFHTHRVGCREELPDARLVSVSQEHGVVEAPASVISRFRAGDLIDILPVHSCLMISMALHILDTRGKKLDTLCGHFAELP